MKKLSLLVCLLLALTGFSAEIIGPTTIDAQRTVKLSIVGLAPKGTAVWKVKPADGQDPKDIEWISDKKGTSIRWIGPTGRYDVTCIIAGLDKDGNLDFDMLDALVTIGQPKPPPTPPTPPTPPVPPGPDPAVVPIPGDGLRVMILYDDATKAALPTSQLNILYAKSVRDYLNSKCPTGPDGKQKEWWILDKDTDVSGIDKKWGDAMKRPRTQTPWLIISTGKTGYEGPLPDSVDKTLELLKKYGG